VRRLLVFRRTHYDAWVLRAATILCLVVALASCVIGQRPVRAPGGTDAVVLLGSSALGPPINHMARHPWLAVRKAGSTEWYRWEVGGNPNGGPVDDFGGTGGDVRVHKVWRGAKAEKAIKCIEREAPPWLQGLDYRAWPGPNSNTFADVMMRRCGLRASLPATSIGKDYRGAIGVSWTSEGTGFQIETWIVGLRLGLKEGVELHFFGMAFGIDLWPPAIIVPLGPGRLGFDDR
jgi:hypothetical protein